MTTPALPSTASSASSASTANTTIRPTKTPWGTPRLWQQQAYNDYTKRSPRDFLAVATPGAGKTSFALWVAHDLLSKRIIQRIIVVAPTEHLKKQWADAAERGGIALDPNFGGKKGKTSKDFDGVVVTYAGVGAATLALRVRCERFKTLVILDELHHAGDSKSWGEAVREAFEPATRRLALTGTPFRSDTNPIPFVTYAPDVDGVLRSVADYTYGYGQALADGVVRPVLFMAYSGDMAWRTSAGDEVAARLGEPLTKDMQAQAWRTALDPAGDWIHTVLVAADRRLGEVRRDVPDAGGLVIATDQDVAREYAKLLTAISGVRPTVVLSDDPKASKKIAEFAESDSRWMVAVRMVSEGVDVPRLAVGVYATSTQTPLFFAQAVGRFVRVRKRGETASVFLPTVPVLLEYAADMEVERDHALAKPIRDEDDIFGPEDDLLALAEQEQNTGDALEDGPGYAALNSQADFHSVLYDGNEFGGELGADETEFLGIPGLLEPDQVKELLRRRKTQKPTGAAAADAEEPEPAAAARPDRDESTYQRLAVLRRELNGLVGAWNHRTNIPHGQIHGELRRKCGGPPAAAASEEQLQQRIDLIREWATQRSR
ncbi:DEAD/DEAH box helicase [Flindersiella endophytica]